MKRKLSALSQGYAAALKQHLKQGVHADPELARRVGSQAAALGLETLDVARIHERALEILEVANSVGGLIERANLFFAQTIKPLGKTRRTALNANARLNRLNQTLGRRTVGLRASNRCLKQGIARHRTAEVALKKRVEHYKKLLEKSLPLQKHLQDLAHQILLEHEDKRKRISRELQDEIAQTLLGINVRLLSVKKAAGLNDTGLQKEIASTQRLVEESVQSINHFARELGSHQPA